MPLETLIVLAVVVAGFAVFAGTLAWINWYARSESRPHAEPAE